MLGSINAARLSVPAPSPRPPERQVSGSAPASLDSISNRPSQPRGLKVELPQLGKQHCGMLERIHSALHKVFAGIRNLFPDVSNKKVDAKPQAPAFLSFAGHPPSSQGTSLPREAPAFLAGPMTLRLGREQLLTAIPQLESMLETGRGRSDGPRIEENFRSLATGLSAFSMLARRGFVDGTVPGDLAERIEVLSANDTVVADGKTASELRNRMRSGDSAFLEIASVQLQLLHYLGACRDAVIDYAHATGHDVLAWEFVAPLPDVGEHPASSPASTHPST